MKYKLMRMLLLTILGVTLYSTSFIPGETHANATEIELQIALDVRKTRISGGETTTGKLVVRRNGNAQELVFRLEHNNASLVRLPVTQIILKPNETEASFEILTTTTPIKSNVTIKALLQPADQVQVQKVVEIVPALIKSVSLSSAILNGTRGNKIDCRVELHAAAPTGGIELLLDIFTTSINSKFLRLDIQNPRVQPGSRETTFEVAFSKISSDGGDGARSSQDFHSADRRVDLYVALEPQSARPWQTISGIAAKTTFDVIQLRVVSTSLQPNLVNGGAEAVATFILNFPPGPNEVVGLRPVNTHSTFKAWARLLGTSCSGSIPSPFAMPLTQGAVTQAFKVCTASVTASTVENLTVSLRGNDHLLGIKIQP